MVHTCPRCELRFLTQAELEEHLEVDHHVDPSQFERFTYRPLEKRPATKRSIVVGNQTLGEAALLDRVAELTQSGHVHLVVPATPAIGAEQVDDKALALATYRMRRAVDLLREHGIEAEGEVSHPDPVHAVARALDHEKADEIILLTLPIESSKWLQVDLPAALDRRFGLPVTVLTATA
jgi:hypothetical protein